MRIFNSQVSEQDGKHQESAPFSDRFKDGRCVFCHIVVLQSSTVPIATIDPKKVLDWFEDGRDEMAGLRGHPFIRHGTELGRD